MQGPLILCNRPVKPHCLFAHHTAQKPERDEEALRAALGCNPTIWGTAGLAYKCGGKYHYRHCFHLLGLHLEGTAKAIMLYEEHRSGSVYLGCTVRTESAGELKGL